MGEVMIIKGIRLTINWTALLIIALVMMCFGIVVGPFLTIGYLHSCLLWDYEDHTDNHMFCKGTIWFWQDKRDLK